MQEAAGWKCLPSVKFAFGSVRHAAARVVHDLDGSVYQREIDAGKGWRKDGGGLFTCYGFGFFSRAWCRKLARDESESLKSRFVAEDHSHEDNCSSVVLDFGPFSKRAFVPKEADPGYLFVFYLASSEVRRALG